MNLYKNELVEIFFGDKNTSLVPDEFRGKASDQLHTKKAFVAIENEFSVSLKAFVFLHQTHGIDGLVITRENMSMPVFTHHGDYLVTNVSGVGIGVVTADCLSIVLVDRAKKAVGVVHAGWKGLVAGVVEQAVERMCGEYGSVFTDINFIIGPSAHACCYEVGKSFFNEARALRPSIESFLQASFFERQGRFFFDAILFLKLIFFEKGFVERDFDFLHAECTICKPVYCSYRREKTSPLRQLTIVSLK